MKAVAERAVIFSTPRSPLAGCTGSASSCLHTSALRQEAKQKQLSFSGGSGEPEQPGHEPDRGVPAVPKPSALGGRAAPLGTLGCSRSCSVPVPALSLLAPSTVVVLLSFTSDVPELVLRSAGCQEPDPCVPFALQVGEGWVSPALPVHPRDRANNPAAACQSCQAFNWKLLSHPSPLRGAGLCPRVSPWGCTAGSLGRCRVQPLQHAWHIHVCADTAHTRAAVLCQSCAHGRILLQGCAVFQTHCTKPRTQ